MGQDDCEPPPDVGYCAATDDAVNIQLNIDAAYATIIGGTPSVNRRATFFLYMPGKGSCTAVAIGDRVALTAAHCRADAPYQHQLSVEPFTPPQWTATGYLEHPDYTMYRSDPADQEARKADLMLLYFDEDLPVEERVTGVYHANPINSKACTGLTAQGWGKTEDDPKHPCPDGKTRCLREGPYTVTEEHPKQLYTVHAVFEPVAICFGDSGGPLYAEQDGELKLAGITSTTSSQDCLVASHHTKVAAFEEWIMLNMGGT